LACGAGAALGAVYNVPFGGALFTIEVLVGSATLPLVLPAVACCFIATVTSWAYLPDHAIYLDVPQYRFTASVMVFALVMGPVVGFLATGYIRLTGWVFYHRVSGANIVPAMLAAFGALRLIGSPTPSRSATGKTWPMTRSWAEAHCFCS
jgi:chloride channel protein, CIC family